MFPTTQNSTLPKVSEIITKGSVGVIALPQNPTVDAIGAASALYLALLKLGKSVTLICSTQLKSDLVGADKAQNSLAVGGDNLVVSFPYTDGTIDKIDYNIQGDKFNLVITPRAGFPKLNPNQVSYGYTGGTFDFLITIDTPNLNAIGQVYTENQAQFQGKEIINIDRHLTNAFFGTINFVNKTSSSTSELVLKVIKELQIDLDKDMATNLYAGVAAATNTFTSYSVNAETFETIASLLKAGATKKAPNAQTPVPTQMPKPLFQPPTFPQVQKPPAPINQPATERQPLQNIATVESQESQSKEGAQSPQDWLKPNIFKGGGLV
jgi:hypothetical protein